MHLRLLFGSAALAIAGVSQAAILFDTFDDGNRSIYAMGPGNTWWERDTASVYGGSRALRVSNDVGQPYNGFTTASVSGGALTAGSSWGNQGVVGLIYGSTGITSDHQNAFITDSRNYDLSAAESFDLKFLGNEKSLLVNIRLYSVVFDGSWHFYMKQFSKTIGANDSAFTANLGTNDIVFQDANYDPTRVDYVYMTFSNENHGDFALDEINAVPEPASMAALALGAAALLRKRRS